MSNFSPKKITRLPIAGGDLADDAYSVAERVRKVLVPFRKALMPGVDRSAKGWYFLIALARNVYHTYATDYTSRKHVTSVWELNEDEARRAAAYIEVFRDTLDVLAMERVGVRHAVLDAVLNDLPEFRRHRLEVLLSKRDYPDKYAPTYAWKALKKLEPQSIETISACVIAEKVIGVNDEH